MAKKVSAIPEGYHAVTPYIIVKNAAKALEFYKKAFDAKELMRMASPDGKCVMHAEMRIGDSAVMLADEFPDMGFCGPKTLKGSPVSMHLYVKNSDRTFEQAVLAGAKVKRPMADQFYGDRSGMVEDPFGHTWNISTHVKDLTPAQMAKAAAECAPPVPEKAKKPARKK